MLWYFICMIYKWIIHDDHCVSPTLNHVFCHGSNQTNQSFEWSSLVPQELGLQSNVVHRNLLLSAYERLSHWQHAIAELRNLRDCTLEARIDEDAAGFAAAVVSVGSSDGHGHYKPWVPEDFLASKWDPRVKFFIPFSWTFSIGHSVTLGHTLRWIHHEFPQRFFPQ